MKRRISTILPHAALVALALHAGGLSAQARDLVSPNGKIKATVTFDAAAGTLTLRATSSGTAIFGESPLGLLTDQAKFTDGLKLMNTAEAKIDETYTLPYGKVATYHNQANELTLALEKGGHPFNVIRNPLGSVDWSPTLFGKDGKTDAYQLATSVVFESALLIFAGHRAQYLAHPAKEFLRKVPAAWDETRLIDGYPGSHTVIARRKGNDWFAGGLTTQAREIALPLGFLKSGAPYVATIFQDQPPGQKVAQDTRDVTASDTLALKTAERGGFVVHLEAKKESR